MQKMTIQSKKAGRIRLLVISQNLLILGLPLTLKYCKWVSWKYLLCSMDRPSATILSNRWFQMGGVGGFDYRTCNIWWSYCENQLWYLIPMVRSAIRRPNGSLGRWYLVQTHLNHRKVMGPLATNGMTKRQPPFRTVRPVTEGQAFEQCNEKGR